MRWNGKGIIRWYHRNPNITKTLNEIVTGENYFMIMVWERYCNASPKPEFFLFSLFIFSFISRLIWVRLGWHFHRWFSIQKQVNWCTIDPFSLKFCTSQHSYPVPLNCFLAPGVGNQFSGDIWEHFADAGMMNILPLFLGIFLII